MVALPSNPNGFAPKWEVFTIKLPLYVVIYTPSSIFNFGLVSLVASDLFMMDLVVDVATATCLWGNAVIILCLIKIYRRLSLGSKSRDDSFVMRYVPCTWFSSSFKMMVALFTSLCICFMHFRIPTVVFGAFNLFGVCCMFLPLIF